MFDGFKEGKIPLTRLPSQFFQELLPEMNDLEELRLVLYFFWRIEHSEGVFRFLRRSDFIQDARWIIDTENQSTEVERLIDDALERALQRGIIICTQYPPGENGEKIYFINSPKGRAAVQAIQNGKWRPGETYLGDPKLPPSANIFSLYEENIGPLTPIIAESLKDAESSYPAAWIQEAFTIAVENNKRNWRYIQAILKRWQEEGRDDRINRKDTEKDGRRYIEGEYADFIEH